MIFELAQDYRDAVAAMPADHSRRRILALLEEAIRRDIHFIARHPTTLFQCMWNTCWWYDCPEAAKHYVEPEGGWNETNAPWLGRDEKIHALMADWCAARKGVTPTFRWLRSLRPPLVALGSAEKLTLRAHETSITKVACSRDGQHIVSVGSSGTISSEDDGAVRAWDAHVGKELGCLREESSWGRCRAVFPDDCRLAERGAWSSELRVWDLKAGQQLWYRRAPASAEVASLAYSPDGRRIVSGHGQCLGDDSGVIVSLDAETKEMRVTDRETVEVLWRGRPPTSDEEVRSVMLSLGHPVPPGHARQSYCDRGDHAVIVWDAESGQRLRCLTGHKGTVTRILYSPDGRRIVSVSDDQTIRVWDAESGKPVCSLDVHECPVRSLAVSFDGRRIATASDSESSLWDVEAGKQVKTFREHAGPVRHVGILPDGRQVVVAVDNVLWIWDGASGEEVRRLRCHNTSIRTFVISPDGQRIISGAGDGTIRVWDIQSARELCCLRGHQGNVTSIDLSADATVVVSGGADGSVRVWDIARCVDRPGMDGHHKGIESVAISADGRQIASGGDDKTLRLWDARTGVELRCLSGHEGYVKSVTYSPDGRRIASGGLDNTVREWDVQSGTELCCLRGHDGYIESVTYSPDGRRIASASWDETVRIWDAESGEELACLSWHKKPVVGLAFSPDGQRIVSVDRDSKVSLWHVESGEQLRGLRSRRYLGLITRVTFSSDGHLIMLGTEAKSVHVYDTASGGFRKSFKLACNVAVADGAFQRSPTDVRETAVPYETSVGMLAKDPPMAWFPDIFEHITTHPACRTLAGARGEDLCILRLEGGDSP